MARLIVTGPAKRDIREAYDWWKENRSAEQAIRWYSGIHAEIKALRQNPERFTTAPESDLLAQGIRQIHFGLGRRPTHRIVFSAEGDTVIVLRVRHASQGALSLGDLGI